MSRERKLVQRLVNGLFWFVLHMVIKTDNEPGLGILQSSPKFKVLSFALKSRLLHCIYIPNEQVSLIFLHVSLLFLNIFFYKKGGTNSMLIIIRFVHNYFRCGI